MAIYQTGGCVSIRALFTRIFIINNLAIIPSGNIDCKLYSLGGTLVFKVLETEVEKHKEAGESGRLKRLMGSYTGTSVEDRECMSGGKEK